MWRTAADRLDGNGDGRIDAAEIEARVSLYRDARDLRLPVRLRFRSGGRPLANASMQLVPAAALAAFEALSGVYRIEGDWPAKGLVAEPPGFEVAADVGGTVVNQTIELRRQR